MCALQQKNHSHFEKKLLSVDIDLKREYNLLENSLRVVRVGDDTAQVYEVFSHTLPPCAELKF